MRSARTRRYLLAESILQPSYIARVKDVSALRLELPPLIETLSTFFVDWSAKATETRPRCAEVTTTSASSVSDLFLEHLGKLIEKVCKIASRDQKKYGTEDTMAITSAIEGLAIAGPGLHRLYEGPGKGRHDNDFADIEKVRIVPTHQELIAEKVGIDSAI